MSYSYYVGLYKSSNICYNLNIILKYILMLIVKQLEQYNNDNIFFSEPISNNIIRNGNFIRILYSTHDFVLNGIYLYISLNNTLIENHYNKYRCSFNLYSNQPIIEKIKQVEIQLLEKYFIINKTPQYKIHDQFMFGYIKLINNTETLNKGCSFILKISGIWETEYNYGLTYKFIKL